MRTINGSLRSEYSVHNISDLYDIVCQAIKLVQNRQNERKE